MQPLLGEVVDERLRPRIGQHAPDLLLEHRRLLQFSLRRKRDQRLVGEAAPQEEREARRKREVAGWNGDGVPPSAEREGGSGPTRNRNSGLARMNCSADSIPRSKSPLFRPRA